MLAGLAALLVAVVTFPQIPGGVRDWRARQRELTALAADQRKQIELERRARLHGWSLGGVATFGVTLVTEPGELERAAAELGGYSEYVILRVSEGSGSGNRAEQLRQTIDHEGMIARAPTVGEREALEAGIDSMGIPRVGPPRSPTVPPSQS
jgi:hypothetical protein